MIGISILCFLFQSELAQSAAIDDESYLNYHNRNIVAVKVIAEKSDNPEILEKLLDLPKGRPPTPQMLSQGIRRLYALNRFLQIKVDASQVDNGIILTFITTPILRLRKLKVIGCQKTDCDSFQNLLQFRFSDPVNYTAESSIKKVLSHALALRGFFSAQIQVKQTLKQNWTSIVVEINEGPETLIRNISFCETPILASAALLRLMRLQPMSRADRNLLKKDIHNIRSWYWEHGFLEAQIKDPIIQNFPDHTVDIIIPIVGGKRSTLVFSDSQFFSYDMLMSELEDLIHNFQENTIPLLQQRLVRRLRNLGYPFAEINVSSVTHLKKSNDIYFFKILPHAALYVRQIRFIGNHTFSSSQLQDQIMTLLENKLNPNRVITKIYDPALISIFKHSTKPLLPQGLPAQHRFVGALYREAAADIAAAYQEKGYQNIKINLEPMLDVEEADRIGRSKNNWIEVKPTFHIEEGAQTLIDQIEVHSDLFSKEEVLKHFLPSNKNHTNHHKPFTLLHKPLSYNATEEARIALLRYLREQGYLYAQVHNTIDFPLENDQRFSKLTIAIDEGPQVHIGHILLRGNTNTRSALIEHRLRLHSGMVFRPSVALATQKAISELDVFDSVQVKLLQEETIDNKKDAIIDMIERTREYVELAAGVSTSQGPRVSVRYAHVNVLGTALGFNSSLQLNRQVFFGLFGAYADELFQRYQNYHGIEQLTKAVEREARIGVQSPRFPGLLGDVQLHADLVDQRINAVMYGLDNQALLVGADTLLSKQLKGSLDSSLGFTYLDCINNADCNLSAELRHAQNRPINVGLLWKFKLMPLLLWDQRDNPISPTRGFFSSARFTYAIGAAAQNIRSAFVPLSFNKYEVNSTVYFPFRQLGLAFAARLGFIDVRQAQVPIDERFFLGGRDSIRGFVESAIVPQDACVLPENSIRPRHCNEALPVPLANEAPLSQGGNSFALLKSELRVPLLQHLAVALFADVGNLWVDITHTGVLAVRLGVGAGMRYMTPVGVLAIDLGFNPLPRNLFLEPLYQLHFSIGAF